MKPGKPTSAPRSAFGVGVLRCVRGSLKRFVALATICALGVTMICGLKVACIDLRASADAFFDVQDLFDLRVQSTLGLTDDDVSALAAIDGVEAAEGGWVETCYTTVGSSSEKVDVKALSPSGMNQPHVLDGHLPVTSDQVAVTRRFLDESGLALGDEVTFRGASDGEKGAGADGADAGADASADASSTEVFSRQAYTICGVVLDPTDINAGNGTMSFRASGGSQYAFFVLPAAVTTDVYTAVYLRVDGADSPLCYSAGYEASVDAVKARVEAIKSEREAARRQGILDDAGSQIDSAERDALAQLGDAAAQLDDAQAQLDSGAAELADGRAQLDAKSADAVAQLDAAQAQLDAGRTELVANQRQVTDGLNQISAGLGCDVDGIGEALAAGRSQLSEAKGQLRASAQMLASLMGDEWPAEAWSRLEGAQTPEEAQAAAADVNAVLVPFASEAQGAIDDLVTVVESDEFQQLRDTYQNLPQWLRDRVDAAVAQAPATVQKLLRAILEMPADQMASQLRDLRSQVGQLLGLADGMVQIVEGQAQLDEAEAGWRRLVAAQAQLDAAAAQLADGQAQLDVQRASARAQLDDAARKLADGEAQLADGRSELEEGRATYERERADALAKIVEARGRLSDVDEATWYVQTRDALSSYSSVESDASSIEAIGTVIPIVFFVVAVLISLTTMTRMVEEERGLIGLYKALGYSRRRILSKYVLYAGAACLAGGLVGNLLGFVVLPLILFTIFQTMYALPAFLLQFDVAYAVGSVALFALGIVGATALTCRRELAEQPAALMRPKAPKAGSRILLERVRPLWRRLSFLNKVTARNIFRYKRRFLMTVFGIAGCTALLVCGFGIRDTVVSLSSRQYGQEGVSRYDLMLVTSAADLEGVARDLDADAQVQSFLPVSVDSVTVSHGDAVESMQVYVVPDGLDLLGYVSLTDDAGNTIDLGSVGTVITKNAEQVLGFSAGQLVHVQDSFLAEADVPVAAICQNYLGNSLFVTESAYREAFGAQPQLNGLLVSLGGTDAQKIALSERLSADSRTLSVVSTAKLVQDFSSAFTLINTVVYVVIVLAAALSFTVVFTLSNTNISERERELATIKVLGFKRPEVHRYINKETLILTGLGVAAGLPAGYALTRSLTWILKMPSLYFDALVAWPSYVLAAALAFAFTLAVNAMTNRTLDRVDMVGALKSAE